MNWGRMLKNLLREAESCQVGQRQRGKSIIANIQDKKILIALL
jgi:hypothetical protein